MIFGHFLRRWFLPLFFNSCGKNLQVRPRVHFESPEMIIIGNDVSFNYNCFVNGSGGLTIGNDCLIGPGVTIVTSNHIGRGSLKIRDLGHVDKPVVIGNNVWIAANVTILPGVEIGDNVIIGAGSIVTKTIRADMTVAGNPAKVIKTTNE